MVVQSMVRIAKYLNLSSWQTGYVSVTSGNLKIVAVQILHLEGACSFRYLHEFADPSDNSVYSSCEQYMMVKKVEEICRKI